MESGCDVAFIVTIRIWKAKKQDNHIQKEAPESTNQLNENQPLFFSFLCSAASFDFTDSTFACAINLLQHMVR